jgi:hypothetical protein
MGPCVIYLVWFSWVSFSLLYWILVADHLRVSHLVKDLPAAYYGIQGFITRADYWILCGTKFIFHTWTPLIYQHSF